MKKFTELVAAPEASEIPQPTKGHLGNKIQGIAPVQTAHGIKIVPDDLG